MSAALKMTNLALVRRIAQGLATNDMRPLIEALDDNVVWKSNTLPPYFRFGGEHLRRSGVLDLLAKVSAEYAFHRYDIDEISEIGNDVWAICEVVAHHRPTESHVTGRIIFHMVFRDGKLVSYEGFFDTARVLQQQGRLNVES
jgi:ketosteroid isomerase-like protein